LYKRPKFPRNAKLLNDGTILYRHTSSRPTLRLNLAKYEAVSALRQKEFAAALIPAMPLLGIIIAMVNGYAATIWPYAVGAFLVYCAVNYVVHKRVTAMIDAILSQAPLAAKNDQLNLPDFILAAQEFAHSLSNAKLGWISLLCFVHFFAAVLFPISVFLDLGINGLSEIAWPIRLFVGAGGGTVLGILCYIAVLETTRRFTKSRRR
jgi:hypothetical protein